MKTSHIVIAVSIAAAAGGGAYLYYSSATRKRKELLKMVQASGELRAQDAFTKMTDDEIKLSYKLLNNEQLNNIEKADLEVISQKYNIFT